MGTHVLTAIGTPAMASSLNLHLAINSSNCRYNASKRWWYFASVTGVVHEISCYRTGPRYNVTRLYHVSPTKPLGPHFNWISTVAYVNLCSLNNHAFIGTLWAAIRQHLTHWGRDKMDAISQTTSSSAFSWMKMFEFRLKFHWSLFLGVQLTIFQHWLR